MPDPPQGATLPASVSWAADRVPKTWAPVQVPIIEPSNYRIVREVARGGVGRILEAVDARLQREVALKQLLRPGGGEEARFIREAVLTARLQHPSIVPIHEVGVFTNGEPFIAMKLVRGESLRAAIRKAPAFADRLELVSSVLSVAEAVAYAHSQRVIHRDLKPANVLLGSFGEVVVIDWGLAKHLDAPDDAPSANVPSGAESTAVGTIVGTPAYMPPEQALGRAVDERADVYSLGAILYEVLTGEPPFTGASVEGVLEQLLTRRPTPVELLVPDVNPDVAAIVRRAMMPDRDARYAHAGELAADLRRYQLGQRVTAAATRDYDAAMEAAFTDELNHRTSSAMRVLAPFAVIAIVAFGLIPRLYHGAWVGRDLWPRGLTVFGLICISVAARIRRLQAASQHLGMAMILLLGGFFVGVNVLEHNAIGWFTGSMIAAFLGCSAMLPLTPRRMLAVVLVMSALALVEGILSGMAPASVPFLVQSNLIAACGLISYLGNHLAFRIRRDEFYNRYQLHRANERLARLDRSR